MTAGPASWPVRAWLPLLQLHASRSLGLTAALVGALLFVFGGADQGIMLFCTVPLMVYMSGLRPAAGHTMLDLVLPVPTWVPTLVRWGLRLVAALAPIAIWSVLRSPTPVTRDLSTPQVDLLAALVLLAVTLPVTLGVATNIARSPTAAFSSMQKGAMLGSSLLAGLPVSMLFLSSGQQRLIVAGALTVTLLGAVWRTRTMVVARHSAPLGIGVGEANGAPHAANAAVHGAWRAMPTRRLAPSDMSVSTWGALCALLRLACPPWVRWFAALVVFISAFNGFTGELDGTGLMLWAQILSLQVVLASRFLSLLPVAPWRRVMLLVITGPGLVIGAFACGEVARRVLALVDADAAAEVVSMSPATGGPYVDGGPNDFGHPTRVRLTHWHVACTAEPPTITAPWGEATAPYAFRALGLTWYNPYSARPENSPRFLEWQWTRLTTAVYGQAVPRSRGDGPWPTLLVMRPAARAAAVLLLLPAVLLVTWGTWQARGHAPQTSVRRMHVRNALSVLPMGVLLWLKFAGPGYSVALDEALIEKGALALVSALPDAWWLFVPSLLVAGLLPSVPVLLLLWRSAREPVPELIAAKQT